MHCSAFSAAADAPAGKRELAGDGCELDYVPVPRTVLDQLPALWGTLRDSTGQPLWPQDR